MNCSAGISALPALRAAGSVHLQAINTRGIVGISIGIGIDIDIDISIGIFIDT